MASANHNTSGDLQSGLLELISREAGRQRAALIAHDVAGVRHSFTVLAQLLAELELLLRNREDVSVLDPGTGELARQLRMALRINQSLLQTGIVAADHLVKCVATQAESRREVVLFSGAG